MIRPSPTSTLFPYTTLFRSAVHETLQVQAVGHADGADPEESWPAEDEITETHREGDQRNLQLCPDGVADRKSTRLNSSHRTISYAVFCLKKKINGRVFYTLR